MKIQISNLTEGEHSYIFNEKPEELGLDDLINQYEFSLITINVRLNKISNRYYINADFCFFLKAPCDRCLDNIEMKIENNFYAIFEHSNIKTIIDEDDIIALSKDSSFIDLTKIVHDNVLLAVPMKKVPEEKDGVCIKCNKSIKNLYKRTESEKINPVWENLIKITNKNT